MKKKNPLDTGDTSDIDWIRVLFNVEYAEQAEHKPFYPYNPSLTFGLVYHFHNLFIDEIFSGYEPRHVAER